MPRMWMSSRDATVERRIRQNFTSPLTHVRLSPRWRDDIRFRADICAQRWPFRDNGVCRKSQAMTNGRAQKCTHAATQQSGQPIFGELRRENASRVDGSGAFGSMYHRSHHVASAQSTRTRAVVGVHHTACASLFLIRFGLRRRRRWPARLCRSISMAAYVTRFLNGRVTRRSHKRATQFGFLNTATMRLPAISAYME